MRLLVAILAVLISVEATAQARKKTTKRPAAPLHSTLYFTPHGKVGMQGELGFGFGSSTSESINPGITATDEYETSSIFTQVDVSYGILPRLEVGLEFGYATATQKNVAYRDSVGNAGVPLEPDAKVKGLYDPEVYATFRPIESDLTVELGGSLRLGFMSAERGSPENTDLDALDRAEKIGDSNVAEGSYGAALGARVGYQLFDQLTFVAALKGEYNFAGAATYKSSLAGDTNVEQDAYAEFSVRSDVEYSLTPEFIIAPFASLTLTPKQKMNFMQGAVNTNLESAGYKTYSVGIVGSYLLQSDLALKAGYAYTSSESSKTQSSTGGAAFVDESNLKDRESHSILAGVTLEF